MTTTGGRLTQDEFADLCHLAYVFGSIEDHYHTWERRVKRARQEEVLAIDYWPVWEKADEEELSYAFAGIGSPDGLRARTLAAWKSLNEHVYAEGRTA